MSSPSFDAIKDGTEKAERFVEWLAGVLRGKNWVTKILLLDVVVFLVFNPLFLPQIVAPILGTFTLPPWYPRIFWSVIGLIFTVALIVAWRTGLRKAARAPVDFTERKALKALRPFSFEDADIFVRLQREQNLWECLDTITDRDFRFGILCGDSGCGKTSFLQAGLWPALLKQTAPHRCVYIKFTDRDPLDTLRQAVAEQSVGRTEQTNAKFHSIYRSRFINRL